MTSPTRAHREPSFSRPITCNSARFYKAESGRHGLHPGQRHAAEEDDAVAPPAERIRFRLPRRVHLNESLAKNLGLQLGRSQPQVEPGLAAPGKPYVNLVALAHRVTKLTDDLLDLENRFLARAGDARHESRLVGAFASGPRCAATARFISARFGRKGTCKRSNARCGS